MENKKKKQEISSVLISLFMIIIVFVGAAIYALPKYDVFIDPAIEFDPAASSKAVVAKKAKDLKPPDFSVFASDRFQVLEKGTWYESAEGDYSVGNNVPFERIKIENWVENIDNEGVDIKEEQDL